METFDYVIIGSGSAGSVLTNRLSEDATTSICVLEAGPSDWHPYIHLPAGFIKTFHMRSIGPDPRTNGVNQLNGKGSRATSGWVFLDAGVDLGGSVLGAVLRRCVPARHLGADNKEVIRLGVGLLATLSAVAISLIASAKSSYDIQDTHFRQSPPMSS